MQNKIVCSCGRWITSKKRKIKNLIFYDYICKCGRKYKIKGVKNILFLCISGSHSYGFAKPKSDIDYRGVFVPTAKEIIALKPEKDIIVKTKPDITIYSLLRWSRLLVKGNGNMLENLFQPKLIEHRLTKKLQQIVQADIISKAFYNHYKGYAWQCWLQRHKGIKWPLHTARLLLSGIHLFETGKVETNLLNLNKKFELGLVDKMIEINMTGKGKLGKIELEQLAKLFNQLEDAKQKSKLKERPKIGRFDKFVFNTIINSN